MATPKTKPRPTSAPARQAEPEKPMKYELKAVTFVQGENVGAAFDIDLGDEGYTEAPSGLSPTALWQTPGEFVEGTFLGVQDEVGPNESRLYSFRMPDGEIVAVWGGTVLDSRMEILRPPVGATVKIVYLGDLPKKPGQNPPRLFKVGWKAGN